MLKFRCLKIKVLTDKGEFGVKIPFKDGLNVFRADNSQGKSTCAQSIIYVMGLERMLTQKTTLIPLPQAMTAELKDEFDSTCKVISSEIWLEVTNGKKEITLFRTVIGNRSKKLITVFDGPALSKPGSYDSNDYYVLDKNSAKVNSGFYHFFSEFIGWSLPSLKKYDGSECLLYLECLFPFSIIEQKRGWSSLEAPLPTEFGIKNVNQRAIEFILNLQSLNIQNRRDELLFQKSKIEKEWKETYHNLSKYADSINGKLVGILQDPVDIWPTEVYPDIRIKQDKDFISISEHISVLKSEWQALNNYLPNLNDVEGDLSERLHASELKLREKELFAKNLVERIEIHEQKLVHVSNRINSFEEDLKQHQGILKLEKLGSELVTQITNPICPTCSRELIDTVLDQSCYTHSMTVAENIEFLKNELKTFKIYKNNTTALLKLDIQELDLLRGELKDLRKEIRSIKEAMVQDSRLPSQEAVERKIVLSDKIRMLENVKESFEEEIINFQNLASIWKNNEEKRKLLPKVNLSNSDQFKLQTLNKYVCEYLEEFEMKSVEASSIEISPSNYLPVHDGFELQFGLSASDLIRTIWAYYLGLMKLPETRHLGLLFLDEPRQQSAAEVSFGSLLKCLSTDVHDKQVIVVTSEKTETLEQHLTQIKCENYVKFAGRILQRQ